MQAELEIALTSPTPQPPPSPLRAADPTLAVLAAQAAAGDDTAFDAIYLRLDGGLRRFLVRRGGVTREQVEELVQLSWVDVWQALRNNRYDPKRAALTTFVYAVAYKIWLQHRRVARNTGDRSSDNAILFTIADDGTHPADDMHLAAQIECVRACLGSDAAAAGLSSEERSVALGLAEGESERSLAARLGIAASTVHARKTSAFQKIRQYIDLRAADEHPPSAAPDRADNLM